MKAWQVEEVQVRWYTNSHVLVHLWQGNGRARQATKTRSELREIRRWLKRNGFTRLVKVRHNGRTIALRYLRPALPMRA